LKIRDPNYQAPPARITESSQTHNQPPAYSSFSMLFSATSVIGGSKQVEIVQPFDEITPIKPSNEESKNPQINHTHQSNFWTKMIQMMKVFPKTILWLLRNKFEYK